MGVDVNDMIQDGYSLKDLRDVAEPMDLTKITAKKSLEKLKRQWRTFQTTEDINDKKSIAMGLQHEIGSLSLAFIVYQKEVKEIFHGMAKVRGCKTKVDSAMKAILRELKNKEKEEKREAANKQRTQNLIDNDADPVVLAMLDRKIYRNNYGEPIGEGEVLATIKNIRTILLNDPRWAGRIKFNDFANMPEIDGEFVVDNTVFQTIVWLSERYGIEPTDKLLGKTIDYVARRNTYNPLTDRLDGLVWDKTKSRIRRLWVDYFGAADTEINKVLSEKFLFMALHRAYQPGCIAHQSIVLTGPQDIGKSMGIEVIALEQKYYADTPFDIKKPTAAFPQIQGKWLVELAEAEALTRSGYSASKSFLTSRTDRYTPKWCAYATDVPRQCIFIITENKEQIDYLSDPTGAKRYLPIKCTKVEMKKLKKDIEQIWAEAVHKYKMTIKDNKGKVPEFMYWLTKQEKAVVNKQIEKLKVADSWEDHIRKYLQEEGEKQNNFTFNVSDIAEGALMKPRGMFSRADARRVGGILRAMENVKCLGRKKHKKQKSTWYEYVPEETQVEISEDDLKALSQLSHYMHGQD